MVPAHQRLERQRRAALERHLGLVVDDQLAALDPAPELGRQREPVDAVLVVLLGVGVRTRASEPLAQYSATSAWRISSAALRPCCGKQAMPMLAQMCSATESTSSGWSSAASSRSASCLRLQLAAVDERRANSSPPIRASTVPAPRTVRRPRRHDSGAARLAAISQVAELVAERVVDRLEVVEVEQHHRHRMRVGRDVVERSLQRLGQRASGSAGRSAHRGGHGGSRCAAWRPPKYTASIGTKHTGTSATLALADASRRRGEREHASGRPRLEGQVLAQVDAKGQTREQRTRRAREQMVGDEERRAGGQHGRQLAAR